MNNKALKSAVLLVSGIFLFSGIKISLAYSQTLSGTVESSQGTDPSISVNALLSQFSNNQESLGIFQENLLKKAIEQLGVADYPATYAYLNYEISLRAEGSSTLSPDNISLAPKDECALGSQGILNCLSGRDAGRLTDEITKLKAVLAQKSPALVEALSWNGPWGADTLYRSVVTNGLSCKHTNNYNYSFQYLVNKDNNWIPTSDTTVSKCQNIKLVFSPQAEWFGGLVNQGVKSYSFAFASPPTDFLACNDQEDCLSRAKEYGLTSDTLGKGVQKVPADFVDQTNKSLTSSNSYMKCIDGVCTPYASGSFPLVATAPASSYFGQCRGFGLLINTPEVGIPAITSTDTVNIANRPPVATVSFDKNLIAPNEEVKVTCDVVDPDECSDKIAKVKWTCTDSSGNSQNCSLAKENSGVFNAGGFTQNFSSSEQADPLRATAVFKAGSVGGYSVSCEATDNDANNPLSGTGINGVSVVQEGVAAVHSSYCAVISGSGEGSTSTICNGAGEAKYQAYSSGIDPKTYKWRCSSDSQVQESDSPNITCSYPNTGSYLPALSIVDKSGNETQCVTQTSTKVTSAGKCNIEVNGDNIDISDQVEATLNKECLDNGVANWIINGGNIVSQNGNTVTIGFNSGGSKNIGAQIKTPDGKTTDCGAVQVNVTEKMRWDQ